MLNLYNSMTTKLESIKLMKDKPVRMVTCGPSLYRQPHIGNYRTILFEDILQRYLEYLGYQVIRLITFTDLEDKAIEEAEKEKISLTDLIKRNLSTFFSDSVLLKIKLPEEIPLSSTIIEQSVKLIKILIEKGYAYWYKKGKVRNIYFDALKFKDFGKLSKIDLSKWPKKKRRFHKDNYSGTPWNKGDFILWHGYKEGDNVFWDTEIGKGWPAWNIQDGAMVTKYLGFTIDIFCGGIDNLVRHHDYNIAIVEAISGKEFANYWLHAGHLFVNGKKMSKSKNNVIFPIDLIKLRFTKEQIRLFLIYENYRKKSNFTIEKLKKICKILDDFKKNINDMQTQKHVISSKRSIKIISSMINNFESHMNNDLNVKEAFNVIYKDILQLGKLSKKGKLNSDDAKIALSNLKRIDQIFQVLF